MNNRRRTSTPSGYTDTERSEQIESACADTSMGVGARDGRVNKS